MSAHLPSDLLAAKTVFISGGGSGVNLAIGRAMAAAGANLAICGRTQSTLDAGAAELRTLGATVFTVIADVRDAEAVALAFKRSADELGPADVVVCGAAGNFLAPAEDISSNGFRAVVEIDLLGSFHCAHAAFEQLKQTRGSLLFVSGGQATAPYAHQAHVGAAKAGVDQLMRTLALEWGRYGIRANCIVPGPVTGTEGMRRLAETAGEDVWAQSVPLGRFARPDEIGAMAVIISSPIASFVNGTKIVVDGGMALSGSAAFNAAVAP